MYRQQSAHESARAVSELFWIASRCRSNMMERNFFPWTTNTVEPVLKDHPISHKNVVSQDWWSFGGWQVQLHWNVGPSARSVWSFKTGGGSSWQWILKTDCTVLVQLLGRNTSVRHERAYRITKWTRKTAGTAENPAANKLSFVTSRLRW